MTLSQGTQMENWTNDQSNRRASPETDPWTHRHLDLCQRWPYQKIKKKKLLKEGGKG
jgi:hypothetical protein